MIQKISEERVIEQTIIKRELPIEMVRIMLKIPNNHEINFIMYDMIKEQLEIETTIKQKENEIENN